MSFQGAAEAATEERGGFFIDSDAEDALEEQDQQEIILQKANALAAENCLKEAIDLFSVAMRYGPVRPEQLSTFADCILRNFKSKAARLEAWSGDANEQQQQDGEEDEDKEVVEELFSCPSCRSFLGEPVTAACGHSYCRRCLQRHFFTKCKRCGASVAGEEKVNVVLSGLLDKWFPEEVSRSKSLHQVDELCRRKLYHDAVSLAGDLIGRGELSLVVVVITRVSHEIDGLMESGGSSAHARSLARDTRSYLIYICPVLLVHRTQEHARSVVLPCVRVCPPCERTGVRSTDQHIRTPLLFHHACTSHRSSHWPSRNRRWPLTKFRVLRMRASMHIT